MNTPINLMKFKRHQHACQQKLGTQASAAESLA